MGIQQVYSINLQCDLESRILRNQQGEIIGVHVEKGEIVDLRLQVEVIIVQGD
jgi:hypothetical protein